MKVCREDGCNNKHYKRGVCQGHYQSLLGTPALPRLQKVRKDKRSDKPCTFEGCDTKQYARGWCKNHYDKWTRFGTPDGKPLPEHGTLARYRTCSCDDCKAAYSEYNKVYSARRLKELPCGHYKKYSFGCRCDECRVARLEYLAGVYEHGSPWRYHAGCRCTPCSEAYSEYKANLYLENDEYRLKGIARGANRGAEKAGVEGIVTWLDIKRLFERYETCLRCGTDENLSVDHVVPMSRGGVNRFNNLQVLCMPCNQRKFKNTIDYRPSAAGTKEAA